jgi:riboflavin kinase / FMN adenylyltransferase
MKETKNAVTIGIFDGVHRGHRALLTTARQSGLPVTALTFDPHPAALLSPSRVPPLLGTLSERRELLRQNGADSVLVLPFDEALAALSPEAFVEDVLLRRLNAGIVVIGEDFRYGCERRGSVEALRAEGERHDFAVQVVPSVFLDGVPVRSTTIRQMLLGGQPESAQKLLGRPYALTGRVVRGKQLGRTLGFPTANLECPPGVLTPAPGVYAGRAGEFLAAISIGVNVTIDDRAQSTVEAYLLDFEGDLYGQELTLEFTKFIRPMQKFTSLDELMAAIRSDVASVRKTKK